jgi:hypothetical protein
MFNSKFLVNVLEIRKLNETNNNTIFDNQSDILLLNSTDKLVLNIYLKTISIKANVGGNNESNEYFFDSDNKLYKYDINGKNPQLANGNFLIVFSNDKKYVNNAYKVSNGVLEQLYTYFDGANLKLIINSKENNDDGTLILTDDYKIFVRIGNNWFGK